MKLKNILSIILLSGILIILTPSCKKFLDEKPDSKLVIPSTLADLWAIMDHSNVMLVTDPYIDDLSSDDFYLPPANFNVLSETDRNVYIWSRENLYNISVNNWSNLYSKVYYANTVLENLSLIERTAANRVEWDQLKGHALFVRSKAFLHALIIWAKAYDEATAGNDMGIPLRLNTNFQEVSTRASIATCYNQIINDLKQSIRLVTPHSLAVIRATKQTEYALLARTYLSMRKYPEVELYADSSLRIYNSLLDYNNLNANASFPIPRLNTEIIFYSGATFTNALNVTNAKIDSNLYRSFYVNDCRRRVFFRPNPDGTFGFKGTYISATGNFSGLATDEVYLMRAEAAARQDNKDTALYYLNQLRRFRYERNGFVAVQTATASQALDTILLERRKELIFRGLRWLDLKRLNKEGRNIILERRVNNIQYSLLPNADRYAMPIPTEIIDITGMPQNP